MLSVTLLKITLEERKTLSTISDSPSSTYNNTNFVNEINIPENYYSKTMEIK